MLLLDTHILHWWKSEPERLSRSAAEAIAAEEELAVSPVTWFELAWLAEHDRIIVDLPIRSWLAELALDVVTMPVTMRIAATAASFSAAFSGDPIDRLIYSTAVEEGIQLVTKDERLRAYPFSRQITIW